MVAIERPLREIEVARNHVEAVIVLFVQWLVAQQQMASKCPLKKSSV